MTIAQEEPVIYGDFDNFDQGSHSGSSVPEKMAKSLSDNGQ